jgi:hypothetical protein
LGLAVAAALALALLGLRLGAGKLLASLPAVGVGGRLARFLAWGKTDWGGAWLVLASGVLAGVINAISTAKGGQAVSADLLLDSIGAAVATSTSSAGTYALIKKFLWPSDKPAQAAA